MTNSYSGLQMYIAVAPSADTPKSVLTSPFCIVSISQLRPECIVTVNDVYTELAESVI